MTTTPIPAAPSLLPGEDSGASDSDGVIRFAAPMLVGQTLPGATIALYDNTIAASILNQTADANGFYSIYPIPVLDDGKHSLTITSTAPGEDTSVYSLPLAIVVDTAAPDPPTAPVLAAGFDTGASALDGTTSKQVLQLTGIGEPGSIVQLYNGTNTPLAQVIAGADGSYTLTTATLADGVYNFTVTATDLAGNIGKPSAATSVTIDSKAPTAPPVPILAPGSDTGVSQTDGLTNEPEPVVTGTAEANATVNVYDNGLLVGTGQAGATGQADGTGTYAITTTTLGEGPQALTVKAVDAAGNTSAASGVLNIVVDTAPATVTITPAAVVEKAGSVTFTVAFSTVVGLVTAADFTLVTTGSVTGSVQSVSGSGSSYTVMVNGLGGDGTVALKLGDPGVTDLAGNAVTLKESDSHTVSGTNGPSTVLVSASDTGVAETGTLGSPSASGRVVGFNSPSGSLVPSGTVDGTNNVFVKDTETGAIALVSIGVDGGPANGDSFDASLSGDGTVIAFASDATNLIEGGTAAGQTNIYVAHLTEGANGPTLVPDSIELVSEGNGQQGEGEGDDGNPLDAGPILSKDGSTVAFDSSLQLVSGMDSHDENVFVENLASGTVSLVSGGTGTDEYAYEDATDPFGVTYQKLTPKPDDKPGAGGDFDSSLTSVSTNGQLIGYQSEATDLGGTAIDPNAVAPPERGYVFNVATQATTNIDGTTTLDPTATADGDDFQTYEPVLSGDGSTVFFQVHYLLNGTFQTEPLYKESLATGAITPLVVPDAANNYELYVVGQRASRGGGLVLYQSNPGLFDDQDSYQIILDNPATGTMTALPDGLVPVLTTAGNAYTFVEEPNGPESDELFETNFGVSAGVDTVGTDDAVGATALAAAVSSGGLTVSGTTNAPVGTAIIVQLYGASPTTNTLNGPAVTGMADGAGHWTATVPTALLQTADGPYALVLQVGTPAGSSFFSVRDFIVDTKAPTMPNAPRLDAGSDSSMAGDGSATNQNTPTLTGIAEAGSTVTLYDTSSATPDVALGTAMADSTAVYAITSSALLNGQHDFDVTATDAAGNVSAASHPVTITVDTIVPDAPIAGLDPASDTGSSQSDGLTSNATPDVVGTAEAGTTVTLYDTDKVATLGTATVGADGKYRITASSLSDGAHTLTVTDTDAAGNVSPASVPIAVTIDTLPPFTPTITSVTGALVSGRIPPLVTVNGTAEPNSKVTLQLDGGSDVLGETTAASDGDYSINSDPLPAGDGQSLAVIAIDAAANASQPSLPVDVNISDSSVPPPGTPPFTPTLLGQLTDGPIAGATVFADANGNGVRDAGEASAVTNTGGQFTLYNPSGTLEATGGTDTTTGLALPGPLFAPAGSTAIDPLTTLVRAYQLQTGATIAAANVAVAKALGLLGGGGTDLTTLNPTTAALFGTPSLDPAVANGAAAVANAELADLAADFATVVGHLPLGAVSISNLFTDVFTVLAAQIAALPAGGTLDLADPVTLLAAVQSLSELAGKASGAPIEVATAASQIVAAGNQQLVTDGTSKQGQALLTAIAGVELVDQGSAAATLARIGANPTLAASLVPNYTGAPLLAAATVTESSILGLPRLAASSDEGLSDRDNVTSLLAPTFVGTALPGTYVTLVQVVGTYVFAQDGQVVGVGQADATGHYSITITPLTVQDSLYGDTTLIEFAAVGSATDQHLALGATISLPQDSQFQVVEFNGQTAAYTPSVLDATPAAVPGEAAGQSALLVAVSGVLYGGDVQVFADGGTTPIASRNTQATTGTVTLTTTPLSLGHHTLTVTETLTGGAVIAGTTPYTVTVTAPTVVSGMATAVGPIAAGTVDQINKRPGEGGADQDAVVSVTDGTGAYVATIQTNSGRPLTLTNGYDTITGLPIGGFLGQTGQIADENVASQPGGVVTLDLSSASGVLSSPDGVSDINEGQGSSTLSPVAQATAGNTAPLLNEIEQLDTGTLLSPLVGSKLEPLAVTDVRGLPSGLETPSEIDQLITEFMLGQADFGLTAQQLDEIATIVAAGNAAIEAHAKAAASVADAISYALSAERLEQEAVLAAVNGAIDNPPLDGSDPFPAIEASYTGAALDQAIEAERARTTQAVALLPAGPGTTSAPSVNFVITFSEAVSGLSAAAFQLVTTGGLEGAAITGVTAVAGSKGTSYDVTVSTGIGDGTVALTYLGGGVQTAIGKPITAGVIAPAVTYFPLYYDAPLFQIATGDFHGDGRPDVVATADNFAGSVIIYRNMGGGSFQTEAQLSTDAGASGTYDPVVADLNDDGNADILILNYDQAVAGGNTVATDSDAVTALLGNGDGSFQQPINTPLGFIPVAMTAGDFNGDGKTDIAVVDAASGTVHVLLGDGTGHFTPVSTIANSDPSFLFYTTIATADLNGDGRLDLVTANGRDGTIAVFLGNGDGTFAAASAVTAETSPLALAIDDLNGDGIPDIAVADDVTNTDNSLSSTVTILLGKGDGSFTALAPFVLDRNFTGVFDLRSIAIGDIDNDGVPDLVLGGGSNNTANLVELLGNGDGTFRLGDLTSNGGTAQSVALADVDGDGRLDVLSPGGDLSPYLASNSGLNVSLNEPETVVGSTSPAITIDRPAVAQPNLSKTSGVGTLTHTGNAYTLDLGSLPQSAAVNIGLSLANLAAAPADSFDGLFSTLSGTGYTLTGATLPAAIAAGSSYAGLALAAATTTLGGHTETLTFAPRDVTNDPAVVNTLSADATDDEPVTVTSPAANVGGTDVALELTPITLTISDDVTVNGGPVAPVITGTLAAQPVTDEAAIDPFAAVVIIDLNPNQTETITVTQNVAADGTVSDPKAAADGGSFAGTVYSVSGTAAQVSAALQGLVFTPTVHQVPPGQTVTTGFTIAVSDTAGQTASDATTSVVATAVDDTPIIGGTRSGQTAAVGQALQPFSSATITDPDAGAMVAVTITSLASGAATDADGLLSGSGLTRTGTGSYVLSAASPAAEQALLQSLVFTPAAGSAGSSVTTNLSLLASDGTKSATDTATTVTVTTPAASQPGGGTTTPPNSGSQPGSSTPTASTPVYRFFDTVYGTHLFTQSLSEAQNILATRPDLTEEANNFGAVNPQTSPTAEAVYRFFETGNGTHFFTANYQEYLGLTTPGTSTYRSDMTYEPNSTFYEDGTQQAGDVAVCQFFDTVHGTQFLTSNQSEFAGLTTAGLSTYRPDLKPEGIAFYAPAGNFSA